MYLLPTYLYPLIYYYYYSINALSLTSSELHFPDVDYFPVSDAKRVRVVVVVRELRALPMFVVRFKYVKEETAAPNSLCGLKNGQLLYILLYTLAEVSKTFVWHSTVRHPSPVTRRKRGK